MSSKLEQGREIPPLAFQAQATKLWLLEDKPLWMGFGFFFNLTHSIYLPRRLFFFPPSQHAPQKKKNQPPRVIPPIPPLISRLFLLTGC